MSRYVNNDNNKKHSLPIRMPEKKFKNYADLAKRLKEKTGSSVPLAEVGRRGLQSWFESGGIMPSTGGIPILGYIPAGNNQPIQALTGVMAYPPESFERGDDDYFLIASGTSMLAEMNPGRRDTNIEDGDLVLFTPNTDLYNGDIVHIEWPDQSGENVCTLKKYYYDEESGKLELRASNSNFPTITLEGNQLEGVTVRGVFKKVWHPEND